MKLRAAFPFLLAAGLLVGCATHDRSGAEDQARLQAKARISRTEAEQVALARVPNGKIKSGDLEEEKGKLIWSFDITTPGSKDLTEVAVDAVTGKIVSEEKETPAQEAREK